MRRQIINIQVQRIMAFVLALAGMGIVAGPAAIIIGRRR